MLGSFWGGGGEGLTLFVLCRGVGGGVGPGSGRTGPVAVGSLPVLLLRFKWRLWGGGGMVSIFSSFTHGLLVFCSGMCVSCRCVITVVGVCLFLEGTMISRGIAFAWPLLARGKKRAWWWSWSKEPPEHLVLLLLKPGSTRFFF